MKNQATLLSVGRCCWPQVTRGNIAQVQMQAKFGQGGLGAHVAPRIHPLGMV